MKKLFLLLALAATTILHAQWDTLNTLCHTNFKAITFISADTGVAVGANPVSGTAEIRITNDGGTSWSWATIPANAPQLNGVRFFGHEGYAVGNDGCVLKSTDAGLTWQWLPSFSSKDLYCVSFPTASTIFTAGQQGALYRSFDNGANWDTLNGLTVLNIYDIYFIQAAAGWMVGDGGFQAATGDGGDSWYTFGQPYAGFFQARGIAYAGTTNTAFDVGKSGMAVTSADAGLTWTAMGMPTSNDLNQVRFGNDLVGLICGNGGFISRTKDGGANWFTETATSGSKNLTDIAFSIDTIAFICGDDGTILRNTHDISAVNSAQTITVSAAAFPNPFTSELNITITTHERSAFTISLCDLSGRVLSEEKTAELPAGANRLQLVTADLPAGIYLLKISGDAGASVLRLVHP
jgi:photosystem II stability/assembly factor-like uncharacterized protein